jgi:hypothetical protein
MATRKIDEQHRRPITLALLKQVSATTADIKAGELEIPIRHRQRYIPHSYDDLRYAQRDSAQQGRSSHARQFADWVRVTEDVGGVSGFDTRAKIIRLEHRRTARKLAMERKAFHFTEV